RRRQVFVAAAACERDERGEEGECDGNDDSSCVHGWAARMVQQGPERNDFERATLAILKKMPVRQRYLFVCINRRAPDNPKGSCAQKGSEELVVKLKEALAKKGLAKEVVRA